MDSERAVLGAICLEPYEALELLEQKFIFLAPEDFTGPNREIFRVMMGLVQKEIEPDLVSLTRELNREGSLASVGGASYLGELIDYVPTVANVAYYAQQVKEHSQRRKLRGLADSIAKRSSDMPVEELVGRIEQVLDNIKGCEVGGPKKATMAAQKARENILARSRNGGALPGIPTGLASLDDLLGGLQPSKLYIIAGRPGMGKTALALDVARHASETLPTLVFSMEMADEELGERLISSEGLINNSRLRFGDLSQDDEVRMNSVVEKLTLLDNLWIDDTPIMTVEKIRSTARLFKRKHGLGLVIIDYLQLISGKGNRYEIVTEASRQLKLLAKEIGTPVIALSQLNRGLENRDDKRPKMSDLRETGALEQDSDVIIFCYRESVYCECKGMYPCSKDHKRKAEIILGKHRGGPLGAVECEYIGENTTFREKEPDKRPYDGELPQDW